MEANGSPSVVGAPMALFSSIGAKVFGPRPSSTAPTCGTTSIQNFPTELIFYIVDEVDSQDLRSLSLTCGAFHHAIQQRRWIHVRLVERQHHVSTMIQQFLQSAQEPQGLPWLKKATRASIIVIPEPYAEKLGRDWTYAVELNYAHRRTPQLPGQLLDLLSFLGNKNNCPKLSHLTFDHRGVAEPDYSTLRRLIGNWKNPIVLESLRISEPIYHRFHTVLLDEELIEIDSYIALRFPNLEWLSIDGQYGTRFREYRQPSSMQRRARDLTRKCPKLRRLAVSLRDGDDPYKYVHLYNSRNSSMSELLSHAHIYFAKNPCLELVTFRLEFPGMIEIEKADGGRLVVTKRDMLSEPREDGWPDICP